MHTSSQRAPTGPPGPNCGGSKHKAAKTGALYDERAQLPEERRGERRASGGEAGGRLPYPLGRAPEVGSVCPDLDGGRIDRGGHMTDRFIRALEQPGSEKPRVRNGSISAAERVTRVFLERGRRDPREEVAGALSAGATMGVPVAPARRRRPEPARAGPPPAGPGRHRSQGAVARSRTGLRSPPAPRPSAGGWSEWQGEGQPTTPVPRSSTSLGPTRRETRCRPRRRRCSRCRGGPGSPTAALRIALPRRRRSRRRTARRPTCS